MPHQPITWRDRLRYRFENTLSKGTIAIIGWLAIASLAIVAFATAVLTALHVGANPDDSEHPLGPIESAWQSMLHALDPGTLAGDQGWLLRTLMLIVTIGGIFIVSVLIGTITSGLEARLTELRKGRSRVVERDHSLILGWSTKVYSIVGELLIANSNQKHPAIVILADRDKVEMEDDLRAKFPDTKNTRIICRSGNPLDLDDLAVVDPHSARSIVILAPETDNPDIYVIKSVLAVTNNPHRKASPYHIVAEVRDAKNLEAAALVGGNEAIYVQGEDLIARVTAQTCRQSGLSVVYTELLDFDGAEIYFKKETSLVGRTYRESIDAFDSSAIIGLMRADGSVLINPSMDTKLVAGDQVIAISEDDDTIVAQDNRPATINFNAIKPRTEPALTPERTLMMGWNEKAKAIIEELDNYVAPGSELIVLCQHQTARETLLSLSKQLKRQRVRFANGDITSSATLAAVNVPSFQHIILLSYNHLPMQEADAQTLITLLHLRNIADTSGKRLNIVSEMMDMRNRALAQVARADDFIVSDKLVSLMLSQLSENKKLELVFKQLFSAEGSEIYIRPIVGYIDVEQEVDFYTLVEAAAQRGETAIGYRLMEHADDRERGYGVSVNPTKSKTVKFGPHDQIIVLAED